MGIIINAKKIKKDFNGKQVVKGTSIQIERGTIHVIEGRSGSGKSTLLSILGGMEEPDYGDVIFKGKSFYKLKDLEQSKIRGESFGYVFQSFHLIPELTVKENIELPLHFSKKQVKMGRLLELTKALGIHDQLEKRPELLSGGEQQRVALARAILLEPEIIFADEPTGNLDKVSTKEVVNELTDLVVNLGISLIVVTHEQNLFSYPHTLYQMEEGVLTKVGEKNV